MSNSSRESKDGGIVWCKENSQEFVPQRNQIITDNGRLLISNREPEVKMVITEMLYI